MPPLLYSVRRHGDPFANFTMAERVPAAASRWSYEHLNDNVGGDHLVSTSIQIRGIP